MKFTRPSSLLSVMTDEDIDVTIYVKRVEDGETVETVAVGQIPTQLMSIDLVVF